MADSTVTVRITGDASQLAATLASAASQMRSFASAANAASSTGGPGLSSMSQQMNNVARGAGMAFHQFGRLNAATTAGGKIMSAMAQQTGLVGKGLAGLGAYARNIAVIGTGFMAVNATIRGIREAVAFAKDAFLSLDDAVVQSMSIIRGNTDAAEDKLTNLSRTLSGELRVQAEDVAKGFYFLASAGLDVNQAMAVTPVVTRYAQAGLMDLEKATEQLMDVTQTFGMISNDVNKSVQQNTNETAKNTQHVADVIARASIDSNATIEQIGTALQGKAGSMAKSLDQNLESATAAIETFASVGIKGSTAGTYYSMALRDLATKARVNRDVFKDLNVEVYNQNGQMNQLQDIIGQMAKTFSGLTTMEQRSALAKMGLTDRSIQATVALLEQNSALQANAASIYLADGAVKEISEKQLKSWAARLDLVKNNLQNLASEGVENFLAGLQKVGEILQPLGQSLGEFFKPFMEGAKGAIDAVTKGFAVIGGLTLKGVSSGLTPIISKIAELKGVTTALGAIAMVSLMKKMGDMAILGTAAGRKVNDQFLIMKSNVMNGSMAIGSSMRNVTQVMRTQGIGAGFSYIGAAATNAADRIKSRMGSALNSVKSGLGSALKSTQLWTVALTLAVTAWQNQVEEGRRKAEEAAGKVLEGVDVTTYEGLTKATENMTIAQNRSVDAANDMGEAWSAKRFGAMVDTIEAFWGKGNNYNEIAASFDVMTEKAGKLINAKAGVDSIIKSLGPGFESAQDSVMKAATSIGIDLEKIGTGAAKLSGQDFENLKRVMTATVIQAKLVTDDVGEAFDGSADGLQRNIDTAGELQQKFVDMFKAMTDPAKGYKDMMLEVVGIHDIYAQVVSKLTDDNKKSVEATLEKTKEASDSRIKQLEDAKQRELDALSSTKRDTVQTIKDDAADVATTYKDAGKDQASAIRSGTAGSTQAEKDALAASSRGTRELVAGEKLNAREHSDAVSDASQAQRRAIEDKYATMIEAERKGSEEASKAAEEASKEIKPNAQQLLDAINVQIFGYLNYKNSLNTLATMEGVKDPISLVEYFSKMKPEEGQALIDEIIAKGSDFATQFGASINKYNTLEKPTWELGMINIQKQIASMGKFQANMLRLQALFPGHTNALKDMAVKLGEKDAPEAFQALVDKATAGDMAGVQAILGQWVVAKEETVAEIATKTEAMGKLLTATAHNDAGEIDAALKEFDVPKMVQMLKDQNFDDATVKVITTAILSHLDIASEEAKKKMRELAKELGGIVDDETAAAIGFRALGPGPWSREAAISKGKESLNAPEKYSGTQRTKTSNLTENEMNQWNLGIEYYKKHRNEYAGQTFTVDDYIGWGRLIQQGLLALANGGVLGAENHTAQISSSPRLWAEPETGGEAYIPLSMSKRARSMSVLRSVAEMFGYGLTRLDSTPSEAMGAAIGARLAPVVGQARSSTSSTVNETNFYGPIQGVDMNDALAFAERQKRRARVTRG